MSNVIEKLRVIVTALSVINCIFYVIAINIYRNEDFQISVSVYCVLACFVLLSFHFILDRFNEIITKEQV